MQCFTLRRCQLKLSVKFFSLTKVATLPGTWPFYDAAIVHAESSECLLYVLWVEQPPETPPVSSGTKFLQMQKLRERAVHFGNEGDAQPSQH